MNVTPNRRVVDLLREDLGMTGTKEACRGRGMRGLHHSGRWGDSVVLSDAGRSIGGTEHHNH